MFGRKRRDRQPGRTPAATGSASPRIGPSAPYDERRPAALDPDAVRELHRRGREAERRGAEGLALRCYEQIAATYRPAPAPVLPELALALVRTAELAEAAESHAPAAQRFHLAAEVFGRLADELDREPDQTQRAACAREEARLATERAARSGQRYHGARERGQSLLRQDSALRDRQFGAFASLRY